jgi:hypothetical protein
VLRVNACTGNLFNGYYCHRICPRRAQSNASSFEPSGLDWDNLSDIDQTSPAIRLDLEDQFASFLTLNDIFAEEARLERLQPTTPRLLKDSTPTTPFHTSKYIIRYYDRFGVLEQNAAVHSDMKSRSTC